MNDRETLFLQPPPQLGNQYQEDRVLRSYLHRVLPDVIHNEIRPELLHIGELAGGELYREQLTDHLNEPRLVQWDPWGNRVDRVEVTSLWRKADILADAKAR